MWLTDLYCLSLKAATAAATTTTTTTTAITTKYKTYFTGEIMTCSTKCQYTRAEILHTLETWFLSGI